jgi:hypothetical protein
MIQINIIAHNSKRFPYTSKSLEFLKKIKDINKEKILVKICYTNASDFFKWFDEISKLKHAGINAEMICFDSIYGHTYMDKIKYCTESECEYSCSMDDDILLSNFLWDFLIENISILDNEENLFLTPLISNGIPSTDIFIHDYCDVSEKNKFHSIFSDTIIDNFWGADFSTLNYKKTEWSLDFYEKIRILPHYYKGIHPVRVSKSAHVEFAKMLCKDPERLLKVNDFKIRHYKFPYFCNSFYFIKTSIWKNIINDRSLYRDNYDEIPLNLYRERHDLNMSFVRNGFCLHMAYNTIGYDIQDAIESYYMENFISKI